MGRALTILARAVLCVLIGTPVGAVIGAVAGGLADGVGGQLAEGVRYGALFLGSVGAVMGVLAVFKFAEPRPPSKGPICPPPRTGYAETEGPAHAAPEQRGH